MGNLNLSNALKEVRFGKASGSFALTMDGQIAFCGTYYDAKNKCLVDAGGMLIEGSNLLYVLPQPSINRGDIVIKGLTAFYYDGKDFINLRSGEKTSYVPIKIFNITFYAVVKNLMAETMQNNNGNNMIMNMLPLLLSKDSNEVDTLLMIMLMNQGNLSFNNNSSK